MAINHKVLTTICTTIVLSSSGALYAQDNMDKEKGLDRAISRVESNIQEKGETHGRLNARERLIANRDRQMMRMTMDRPVRSPRPERPVRPERPDLPDVAASRVDRPERPARPPRPEHPNRR